MDRLEEIRERLARYQRAVEWDEEREAELADLYSAYTGDVPYLIERIRELEGTALELVGQVRAVEGWRRELEAENQKLRDSIQEMHGVGEFGGQGD